MRVYLTDRHCVPCEGGDVAMERVEAHFRVLDGWNLSVIGKVIRRRYAARINALMDKD